MKPNNNNGGGGGSEDETNLIEITPLQQHLVYCGWDRVDPEALRRDVTTMTNGLKRVRADSPLIQVITSQVCKTHDCTRGDVKHRTSTYTDTNDNQRYVIVDPEAHDVAFALALDWCNSLDPIRDRLTRARAELHLDSIPESNRTSDTPSPMNRAEAETNAHARPSLESEPEPESTHACVVCLDRKKTVVFMPCKHMCTCATCAEAIVATCPLCRKKIDHKINVFV